LPRLSSSRGSRRRVSKRLRNAIFEIWITKLFDHNLLRVDPLSGIHDCSGFDSRVEPLDRYLKAHSGHDDQTRLASCFALCHEGQKVIGFYTLEATSVSLVDLALPVAKKIPNYPVVPAILMVRLAVDNSVRGCGLGRFILIDAFSRLLRSQKDIYALIVEVNDEAAISFYEAHCFLRLAASGRRLFLPLAEIAKLFT
jgi:ribosomal protein S18 acetylase RimI-like enzyme